MNSQNNAANENKQCYDLLMAGMTYRVGHIRFSKVKRAVADAQKGSLDQLR